MKELLSMDVHQLETLLADMGEKPFVARQLKQWLLKGVPFENMTNLSAALRSRLRENFSEGYAHVAKKYFSDDGTVKYLLRMYDGILIECVLMQYHHGNTLCVSTQAGCRMGCAFCASGKNGLKRNLSAGEMCAQFIAAKIDKDISNVVLMGSGEPLDNYDNTLKFIRILADDFGIGLRHISVSTCGLVPNILKIAQERLPITLCISLHAATDTKRKKIMPVANAYDIEQILKAAKVYFKNTGRRIIIEYTLIKGFNDGQDDIEALVRLLKGFTCHVNVIPLNISEKSIGTFKLPSARETHAFAEALEKAGISATVRRALGSDIKGACGQLVYKKEGK